MPDNHASGPQMGQMVIYTETSTLFYPAIVTAISATTGLARLTTFAPGGSTTDKQSVSYDGTGVTANTWRWPDILTGT